MVLCAASFALGAFFMHVTAWWWSYARMRRRWRVKGLKDLLLSQRRRHFCRAQSVSYENKEPLLVVRGFGSRLLDENGTTYLDTRNNVCHVGHAHPAVAAAVAEQVAILNTNTRYLHMNICDLARKLLSTLPAPLDDGVVFVIHLMFELRAPSPTPIAPHPPSN